MDSKITDALEVAQELAPQSIAIEAIEAVAETIAAPTPANIINDLQVALKLLQAFKAKTANMHPDVINIIKGLL